VNATAKQQLSRNPSNAGYSNPIKTYPVPAVTNEDGTISIPAQPVYLIDPLTEPIPIGSAVSVKTIPGGTVTTQGYAVGIGAGGVSMFLPANSRMKLVSLVSDTTMTATVGNRILQFRVLSGGVPVWVGPASTAVTATQVGGYDVNFGGASAPSTTVRRNLANTGNTNVQVTAYAPALEIVNITAAAVVVAVLSDSAAIDAADSTNFLLSYILYPV
jgi:hypothetical protein